MAENHGSGGDDDERQTVRRAYDWQQTEPSVAIVEAIANVTDREPTAVSPLLETADPDAIDTLLLSADGTPDSGVSVSVRLDGYEVTVSHDGTVSVDLDRRDDDSSDTTT